MDPFIKSFLLLFMLLNPFLLIIYLDELGQERDCHASLKVLIRASCISSAVFITFALLGDLIFEKLLQANFAAFQIFGGIVFLTIGLAICVKRSGCYQKLCVASLSILPAQLPCPL